MTSTFDVTPAMRLRIEAEIVDLEAELAEERAVVEAFRRHADDHDRAMTGLEQRIRRYREVLADAGCEL